MEQKNSDWSSSGERVCRTFLAEWKLSHGLHIKILLLKFLRSMFFLSRSRNNFTSKHQRMYYVSRRDYRPLLICARWSDTSCECCVLNWNHLEPWHNNFDYEKRLHFEMKPLFVIVFLIKIFARTKLFDFGYMEKDWKVVKRQNFTRCAPECEFKSQKPGI